jgi:hypothetical protein
MFIIVFLVNFSVDWTRICPALPKVDWGVGLFLVGMSLRAGGERPAQYLGSPGVPTIQQF